MSTDDCCTKNEQSPEEFVAGILKTPLRTCSPEIFEFFPSENGESYLVYVERREKQGVFSHA